jgi:hypothetical protein
MPELTGCPRRMICVCESTVSVTPPADWSSVMLFSSTLATAPVTVLRLTLSLLLPETVPPAAVEPALP